MAQSTPSVIPLPQAPQDPDVPLPAIPAAPPTSDDVLQSVEYQQDVIRSLECKPLGFKCSTDDVRAAVVYAHRVASQASDYDGSQADMTPPPWFFPAVEQALRPIQERVNRLQADLKRVINSTRYEGDVISFDIVPFPDGSDPTQAPHHLPPLRSFQSINDLSRGHLVAYLRGYGYGGENAKPLPVGQNEEETDKLQRILLRQTVIV